MSEYLHRSLGFYNGVWVLMALAALWFLFRIYELLKAIHQIEVSRMKRERPDALDG